MALPGLILGGLQLGASLIGGSKAQKAANKAEREQRRRYNQAMAIYDNLSKMYQPGSQYGKSLFEGLAKQKQLDVGATAQQYLRSGIGGTSFADVNAQYEQNTGRQSRRTLEDFLTDKYAGVQSQKANFMAGVQTVGPSYSDIMGAYSGVGQGLGTILGELFPGKPQQPVAPATQTSTPQVAGTTDYFKNLLGQK